MIDELDILRAANILIKRYGTDAALEAARRADQLLKAGDTDGCAIWKRILSAVHELTRTTLAEGERVNGAPSSVSEQIGIWRSRGHRDCVDASRPTRFH